MTQTQEFAVPRVAATINLAAIGIGIACIVLAAADISSPVRVWLAVALFTFGPGSGLVQFLKIRDGALQIGVMFAISAAVLMITGQVFLMVHNIDGLLSAITLTVITCIRPIYRPVHASEGGDAE